MKGLKWRLIVIIGVVLTCAYLLVPTFLKFGLDEQIPKVPKDDAPWYHHVLPSEALKLGLDLRGGLHLVLGIDFDEVRRDAATKLKNQLSDIATTEKIDGMDFETNSANQVIVRYPSDTAWEKFDAGLSKANYGPNIDFVSQTNSQAVIRMSDAYADQVKDQALQQAVETLRNRIDEFGIAEPIITKQGSEKILVQFPGVSETTRLKDIISRTAKLSFQLVRTGPEIPDGMTGMPSMVQINGFIKEFETAKKVTLGSEIPMSDYLKQLNQYLETKLPKGTEIVFNKELNVNTREPEYKPYLLQREPMVTGEDLADASQGYDPQTNLPEVNFTLTPVGAGKFEKATGEHVNEYMAIVLDNNVHTAPVIKGRIGGGRARIEMGSVGRPADEVAKDAKDTALVLRSGALPARLLFLEERVIGPSLGKEAIRSGSLSLIGGLVLVFLFLLLYYRGSGVIASFALLFNSALVFSFLAAFEGTLTLPGLAGLALTLGMAVDANVLIFEHMREELRAGKSVNMSVAEGYKRALSAILDGNITTLIAAFVLLQFGYGPIRGFAVTLVIGIMGSVFTAIFVTRFIFDYFVVAKNKKTISI